MDILKKIALVIIGFLSAIGIVLLSLVTKLSWIATGVAFVLYLLQFYVTDWSTVVMLFWFAIKLTVVLAIVMIILAMGKILVEAEDGKGL